MTHFSHGGDLAGYTERYPGRESWLDFSASIGPLGMPEPVRRALAGCADSCLAYPDPHCRALCRAVAGMEGVAVGQVLCGAGAADLIYRIALALRPGRALVCAPTFSEYQAAVELAGGTVEHYLLAPEKGFLPGEDLVGRAEQADVVFLCSPNNPTGTLFPLPLLERVLRTGAHVVVDECFLEFVEKGEDYSAKRYLQQSRKLIILKAHTKIFALPGLRLGYCLCGDGALLERIGAAGPPWAVSAPAQLAGIACAGERDFVMYTRELVAEQRAALSGQLAGLGLRVWPGAANFLLFQCHRHDLAERLAEQGLLIRDCRGFYGLGPGWYRIAVRGAEDNRLLLGALAGVLGGEDRTFFLKEKKSTKKRPFLD